MDPHSAIRELLATLEPRHRRAADEVIQALARWSQVLHPLVRFDPTELDFPAVRYVCGVESNVLWRARHTTAGDAKIEILTRTAKSLPVDLGTGLRSLLRGVLPGEAFEPGRVL